MVEYSITGSEVAELISCKKQDVYNSASYGQMIKKEFYAEVVDRPLSRTKDLTLLLEYDRVCREILERVWMMKVYKAVHERENKCKELHKEMNMNVGPTRLVQPDFYLLVDVDDLQKQVNTLENEVHRTEKMKQEEMALWKKKLLRY